jgi:hypothetical protein
MDTMMLNVQLEKTRDDIYQLQCALRDKTVTAQYAMDTMRQIAGGLLNVATGEESTYEKVAF